MQHFPTSPIELVRSMVRNRSLTVALIKREVAGRYNGSVLGLLWSFFNPLFMLAVYTFVFSVVFNARWNIASSSKTEFALMLFAGLMIFNLFAECVTRAPAMIIGNTNYVKKVVFPLEVLALSTLGTALFHFVVSLIVWLLAYVFFFGQPHYTILFLPVILLPLMMLILGLVWFLSSMGVYLRDVSQIIGVLTSMLMFLSPIFYPITALPEQYRAFLYFNPLTAIIEMSRGVLFLGELPSFKLLGLYYVGAAVIFWLGFVWFQKTRKGFADVL